MVEQIGNGVCNPVWGWGGQGLLVQGTGDFGKFDHLDVGLVSGETKMEKGGGVPFCKK